MTKQWGGQYTNAAGECLFDNKQSRDAISFYVDMFKDGLAATPKFFNADFASDAFVQEKVYMTTGSSAGVSYNDPKGAFEVGIAPIPQKAQAAKNYVIQQGTNVTLFKQEDPQVELAGWLFMKFLTSPQETLRWATNTSYFPVRKSAYLSAEYQAHLFGPIVKKQNGDDLVINGQVVRGTILLNTEGKPTYDANGVPAYEAYEPTIQSYGTKIAYDQMDDFYTDPAFPGSSSARDEVELLVQAILYGEKTIDQAYAEALGRLAE
jgi:ABC-type glycerol-3-phosphate transport system substrate-binding protein